MSRDLRARGLTAAVVKPLNVKGLAGKQHNHGCLDCDCRYVCACESPEIDRQCNDCRQGRGTFIMMGAKPKQCCYARRPATRKECSDYSLAGQRPWFICTTCWRKFTAPGEER